MPIAEASVGRGAEGEAGEDGQAVRRAAAQRGAGEGDLPPPGPEPAVRPQSSQEPRPTKTYGTQKGFFVIAHSGFTECLSMENMFTQSRSKTLALKEGCFTFLVPISNVIKCLREFRKYKKYTICIMCLCRAYLQQSLNNAGIFKPKS